MKPRTFWILWNPSSSLPPTVRFWTRDDAMGAAKSMVQKSNQAFYVCKVSARVEPPTPPALTVVDFDEEEQS